MKYLKKYERLYKVRRSQDRVYEILCSGKNNIYPYSVRGKLLCFYFSGLKTRRAKNNLVKKLKFLGIWFEIHQEGDLELVIKFKEADLPKVEKVFKIRKKKQYKPEYRQVLVDRIKEKVIE